MHCIYSSCSSIITSISTIFKTYIYIYTSLLSTIYGNNLKIPRLGKFYNFTYSSIYCTILFHLVEVLSRACRRLL